MARTRTASDAPPYTALGDERRQALIDAAYQIIAERGMEGLRLRDVAAQAGMHHATLHYYFPTKDDLIQAVTQQLGHEFTSSPAPGAPDDLTTRSATEQLHWYLVTTEHQLLHAPERFLVIAELLLHARRDAATRRLFEADPTWHAALVPLLATGVASGEFRQDLDVQRTAEVIMTFSMGLPLALATLPDALHAIIAQFEVTLLQGIAPPSLTNAPQS